MAYDKQIWDTNSIFNPTRMNHIEDGIKAVDNKINSIGIVNVSQGSFSFDSNTNTYKSRSFATVYTGRSILLVNVNLGGASNMIAHANIDNNGYIVVTGISPNGTKFNGTEIFNAQLLCINP